MSESCVDPRVLGPPYLGLVAQRVVVAPRESVWEAWTDPDRLREWWGPEPFTAPVARMDVREGGRFEIDMRSPEGRDYWNAGRYCELVPSERLVASVGFSDGRGNVVPASTYGLKGDFPDELLWTVTLEDAGSGRTRVTVREDGFPNEEERDNARLGWGSSLDRLGRLVDESYANLPETPF